MDFQQVLVYYTRNSQLTSSLTTVHFTAWHIVSSQTNLFLVGIPRDDLREIAFGQVLNVRKGPFLILIAKQFAEIPEKVARFSSASVLVVKRYEGRVRSLLKRAFG